FALPSAEPEQGDAAVDQGRTDGAVFDRQQFVRGHFDISRDECGTYLDLQTRPVTIGAGRRGTHLDLERQFQLGGTAQGLAQSLFLDLELLLIADVLIVTPATAAKIWARRLNPVRRGLDNGVNRGSRKSRLLLGEASLNFFSGQDIRDENSLAALAGSICAETGGGKIGGQTGQAIAAIDQLFDGKKQELILRH